MAVADDRIILVGQAFKHLESHAGFAMPLRRRLPCRLQCAVDVAAEPEAESVPGLYRAYIGGLAQPLRAAGNAADGENAGFDLAVLPGDDGSFAVNAHAPRIISSG